MMKGKELQQRKNRSNRKEYLSRGTRESSGGVLAGK